jgi:27-O-demethylrifamycin SV methyltransferase
MPMDAKDHYNHVTDAWKEFMGEHLHFGYFETEDVDLSKAVEVMTDRMLGLCDISEKSRILDVGCGIGGPAFYIHEKYKCAIDGISTSQEGIDMANKTSEEKGYDNVKFKVADGLDNGFPDNSFDIVWVMESSHLMPDKWKLCKECFRVLKSSGTMVLCDLIRLTKYPNYRVILYGLTHFKKFVRLSQAFGPAQLISLGAYCDFLLDAGFNEVTVIDVSEKSAPTAKRWKENAIRFGESEFNTFSRDDVQAFIDGCDFLAGLFKKGLFGYGMLRAKKP